MPVLPLPLKLDFGTGTSPLKSGYLRAALSAYSATRGYGWEATTGLSSFDNRSADPDARDYHKGTTGTYLVDLPDGRYKVSGLLVDPDWRPHAVSVTGSNGAIITGLIPPVPPPIPFEGEQQVSGGRLRLQFGAANALGITGTARFGVASLMIERLTPPLIITAGPDVAGEVGQSLAFNGQAQGGTPPYQFAWTFSDGGTATGATVQRPFTTAATFTATLTVTDAAGVEMVDEALAVVTMPVPIPPVGEFIVLPHDTIPFFAARPTLKTIAAGSWHDPAIWDRGRVPGVDDDVQVSHFVTTAAAMAWRSLGLMEGGYLRFDRTASFEVLFVNVQALGGRFDAGFPGDPLLGQVTLTFRDVPVSDQKQYSNILFACGGRITVHGRPLDRTWVEGEQDFLAGDTELLVKDPVHDWQAGDKVGLSDTRAWGAGDPLGEAYELHVETVTIAAVSADGRRLSLTGPIKYDHRLGRNAAGLADPRCRPHLFNLTRNVTVRSENAAGTRGHTFWTHRADVSIRYTALKSLGRTTIDLISDANPAGRYPAHFHNLLGPAVNMRSDGRAYDFIGNVIACGLPRHRFKWGLTIHDAHFGDVRDNVIFNWRGAGVMFEQGNEYDNWLDRNFACRIWGNAGGPTSGAERADQGKGNEGAAYWCAGNQNRLTRNVACNTVAGYVFYPGAGAGGFRPLFPGADTEKPGERQYDEATRLPVLEFAGNQAYACSHALIPWQWGIDAGNKPISDIPLSFVDDFLGWNFHDAGIFWYPCNRVRVRRPVFIGPYGRPAANAVHGGDYAQFDIRVSDFDFQNCQKGWGPSQATGGEMVLENGTSLCTDGVLPWVMDAMGLPTVHTERRLTLVNVRHSGTGLAIRRDLKRDALGQVVSMQGLFCKDVIESYHHQGVVGDSFRLWHPEQRGDFKPPLPTGSDKQGTPVAGLTNAELFAGWEWSTNMAGHVVYRRKSDATVWVWVAGGFVLNAVALPSPIIWHPCCVGGELLPADAVPRSGVSGLTTRI